MTDGPEKLSIKPVFYFSYISSLLIEQIIARYYQVNHVQYPDYRISKLHHFNLNQLIREKKFLTDRRCTEKVWFLMLFIR